MRPPSTTIADVPGLLALWDAERNAPLTAGAAGARSSKKKWWRCPVAADHIWQAPPASVSRSVANGFSGCPACAGRQVSTTNSVAALFPEVAAQWHPTRNGSLTPSDVTAGTGAYAWWTCDRGPDHEWRAVVVSRTKGGSGCPACAGLQASVTNSVATHPVLADEWHPTKNLPLTADGVVASTSKKLWWRCAEDPSHEWQAIGANRVYNGQGCPLCVKTVRSTLEICVTYELQAFFPELDLDDDKILVDGRIRNADIVLRSVSVVIELDGRYHHDGKDEADRRKVKLLEAAGWRVIRLREAPLAPLGPHDVQLPENPTTKRATDAVLVQLRQLGWANPAGVDDYLRRTEPDRLALALDEVGRRRPGKPIRVPGTPPGPDRASRWETGYTALCAFVAREGHAKVLSDHREGDVQLGRWVTHQRMRYKRDKLLAERAARLEAVPGWIWDAVASEWEEGFDVLQRYLAREGHVRVPVEHIEDGLALGQWVRSHRRPGGGRRTITDEQRARLEAVPGWTYESPVDEFWDRAYTALADFARAHGHVRNPSASDVDLRGWVGQQRQKFRAGTLPGDRVRRLESLPGWSWDPTQDAWEVGFAALTRFAQRTGSALVPPRHAEAGYALGAWVREQRTNFQQGTLSADRVVRLQSVPGWSWSPHDDRWDRHFDALRAFVGREGHARVPADHVEAGMKLGSWVVRHRGEYARGTVPASRVRRLEALPGWVWDTRETSWDEHLEALVNFVAEHGHASVPYAYEAGGKRLGQWVVTQRHRRRNGTLRDDRVRRLDAVPGWVWDGRVDRSQQPQLFPTTDPANTWPGLDATSP